MSEADLDRMETALGLRLPAVYRSGVSPFPVGYAAGNTDSPVWDDADALIALNRQLRGEPSGWPEWLFVIGRSEGDPSGWAIDTRSPDAPVWWLERMRLGPNGGAGARAFTDWFRDVTADLREMDANPHAVLRAVLLWLVLSVSGGLLFLTWAYLRGHPSRP